LRNGFDLLTTRVENGDKERNERNERDKDRTMAISSKVQM